MEALTFEFRPVMDAVAELTAPSANEKGLDLYFVTDPEIPSMLKGDEEGVRQILAHLVKDAIASTEKGEVGVRARARQRHLPNIEVEFSVTDSGYRGSEEKPHHLLADSNSPATAGDVPGPGIIASLVTRMNGKIRVEHGAGIHLIIPFENPGADECPVLAHQEGVRGTRVMLFEIDPPELASIQAALTYWQCPYELSAGEWEVMDNLADAHITGLPFNTMILGRSVSDERCDALQRNVRENRGLSPVSMIRIVPGGQARAVRSDLLYLESPIRHAPLLAVLGAAAAGNGDTAVEAISECLPEPYDPGQIRVLVAEDNMTNQKVAMYMLAQCGFQADAVSNGKAAVEAVKQNPYDLVLMDIQMPVMDGYDATAEIRRMESEDAGSGTPVKRLPIIAMTANAMKGDRQRCLDGGMDDYIPKPVNIEVLTGKIEKWVGVDSRAERHVSPEPVAPPSAPPVTTESPDEKLPLDYEKALHRMMGDRSFLNEMLSTFITQFSEEFEALERAIHRGAAEEVQKRAHKIKGAALSISADVVSEVALALERLGRSGELDTALDVLSELKTAFVQLEAHIRRIQESEEG